MSITDSSKGIFITYVALYNARGHDKNEYLAKAKSAKADCALSERQKIVGICSLNE